MKKESMTTSAVATTDLPLAAKKKKKIREFTISNETFNRFATGRTKFERWGKYLNLLDEAEKEIFEFHRKNPGAIIYLRNEETGALRAIRKRSANE
jgi:hypothetical protein